MSLPDDEYLPELGGEPALHGRCRPATQSPSAPPFDLPEPLHLIEDRLDEPGFKFMGVWSREQLTERLG